VSSRSNTNINGGAKKDTNKKTKKSPVYIDPSELTGIKGLKRSMIFLDSKNPAKKGEFEYKPEIPHIFKPNEIGKYSSKIKKVCESIYNSITNKVSDGIILIYSSHIDGGLIPMALALEEMGMAKHGTKSLFKKPPVPIVDYISMKNSPTKNNSAAKYAMITGDSRLSPNNDADVKTLTDENNINGSKIKVVLISQAGSEGLDFKGIRQIHILEPWYNVNRQEQIIGRGVRNFSHKDLPFNKRNVQIFLHGAILNNSVDESADLYVYRQSEIKAIRIGEIARLLKQTAVDCNINHDQTQLTSENFSSLESNRNITQLLSTHIELKNFEIGDIENSSTCDYMQCEFKCLPEKEEDIDDSLLNLDTYNETFMLINSDKIINKIRTLMRVKHYYEKDELFKMLNFPKKYPTVQIYSALSQLINDNAEYILDMYGRTGNLINIGEYYLFQPSEINFNKISIYERKVPIDFKPERIKYEFNSDVIKPLVIDKKVIDDNEVVNENIEGLKVLDNMYANYTLALATVKVKRGVNNWYHHCGIVIRKMNIDGVKLEILEGILIEHIVDCLVMNDKVNLMNYLSKNIPSGVDLKYIRFFNIIKSILDSKVITRKSVSGMILFDGPSRIDNENTYILKDNIWVLGEPEDLNDLKPVKLSKYTLNEEEDKHKYIGFIGFDSSKNMVFKVKDIENNRSTGARCVQSGKENVIEKLKGIDETIINKSDAELGGLFELCVREEITLRLFEKEKRENKRWFVDTETAIINEFEKKEK